MVKNVTMREAWSGEADCRNCSLRHTVLFAGLTEADFEKIHDPIDQFSLKPGACLYHAGDRGEYLFTVRTGALKLVQYLPDGSQRIVRLARSTDVLGLEAILEAPLPARGRGPAAHGGLPLPGTGGQGPGGRKPPAAHANSCPAGNAPSRRPMPG